MKECSWPPCREEATHGIYCFQHNRVYGTKQEKPKAEPIAKRSVKLTKEMNKYKPEVEEFLSRPENQFCAIRSPVCTGKAVTVNHTKRRGKNLRNQKDWKPSCSPCNLEVELKPKWAYENGHLIKVHTKTQDNETTT